MSAAIIDDAIDCRNAIRGKSIDLAESGIFADCEGIRLALSSTSHAVHLQHVFASPFFLHDLNQRCRAARMGGPRRDADSGYASAADPSLSGRKRRRKSSPAQKSTEFASLARAIAASLGAGHARTAGQLAQQLHVEARSVRRALRAMLADGEVHIAGSVTRAGGGATARLFRLGRAAEHEGSAADSAGVWAVVLHAMDAFARHA